MQNNQQKREKKALRKNMCEMIRNYIDSDLGQDFQKSFATKVKNTLCNHSAFFNADIILGYYPMKYEASCLEILLTSIKSQKEVYLPKIDKNTMTFHFCKSLTADTFTRNSYGIYEPTTKSIDFSNLLQKKRVNILVIVPGLAFSKNGKRLGRGKGYYDKFLSELIELQKLSSMNFSLKMVGLCFSFQIVDELPTENHDILVNYIVTEKECTLSSVNT